MFDLAAPACPSCASSHGSLVMDEHAGRFVCHDCAVTTTVATDELFWSTPRSNSELGQDIVYPGVDIELRDSPQAVIERCWLIAQVFQSWDTDALAQLVENWAAVEQDFAGWVRELFGCAVSDLVVVAPRDDPSSQTCRFATASKEEMVLGFSAGPVLMDPGDTKMAAFVHFNVRYNLVSDRLVGQAFDFYADFG